MFINILQPVSDALYRVEADYKDLKQGFTRPLLVAPCKAGRIGRNQVFASRVDDEHRDGGKWLYDFFWLEYDKNRLVSAPLACECEWNPRPEKIDEDSQKLLVANATVALMIYDGGVFDPPASTLWNAQAQEFFKRNAAQSLIDADRATYVFFAWTRLAHVDGWQWQRVLLPGLAPTPFWEV